MADQVSDRTLRVVPSGDGNGTITSSVGIDCGSTCEVKVDSGAVVTLTAVPGAGSSFAAWAGADCDGMDCTVVVDHDVSIGAEFAIQPLLNVIIAGNGGGKVTSDPAGIDCPSDCSDEYAPEVTVTLTATPAVQANFIGWSGGGCIGDTPCQVSAGDVTATFAKQRYTLTVAKSGTGTGTITSNVGGINCGSACQATYDADTVVMLSATAQADSTFTGWSGGSCSGTGVCTVTMSQARTVNATFTCNSGSATFDYNGGTQTLSRPACVRNIVVDARGAAGGASSAGGAGGLGGRTQATLSIGATDVVTVIVGSAGGTGTLSAGGGGGFNGGAPGGLVAARDGGGGGGGGSEVRIGGVRAVVGGGGGGAGSCDLQAAAGGSGGGLTGGSPAATCFGVIQNATGGTQSAGGQGGLDYKNCPGAPGTFANGGAGCSTSGGGGGGGGYYGGGGGASMGGGGGSSYTLSTATGVIHTQATQPGNGRVIISW